MIDTGATSSLITMEKIIQLNLLDRVYHQPGEIILGDSITKIHQKGSIDLTFRIKYLTCTIQAKIVDKLTYGIILGMDFVTQYQVDIHTRNQFILLHHQGQKLRVDFEKPQSVRTKQEYTILPRCKRVIDAQVCGITDGRQLLFKAIDDQIQQAKRVRLCDGLVDIVNYQLQLTIYNPTTRSVTLPKHMVLGIVDQLSSDVHYSTLHCVESEQAHTDLHTVRTRTNPMTDSIEELTQHIRSDEQHYQPLAALLRENYAVFDTTQPKTIKTTVHHVINTENHSPINAKPYVKSIEQRQNIQQEIDRMLKAGIIVPSNSPWSSPVILLTKPNGEFRFIIDYRRLNSITVKDAYPQPTVEELLQRLGGHGWFTKLDLKSGYYQIPIQQSDKPKTAFITQDGLYQFEVLPMGLMNAPATFQRTMNNIIGYNRWNYVLVYLDDILIFSKSFQEHMKHLREIFTILNHHNFTLNLEKCSVAKQSIEFLSHTITADSIVPMKERIQAILDIPQPTTLAQANKFIGKIGWYRKFIPEFAKIAAPIHKVTNKTKNTKKEFFWSEEQKAAANKLKNMLTTEPLMLKYPNPTAPFILSTDASEYAIGGTLKQVVGGKTHYNYFLSRLLTDTEKNYPTIDREALAIFWCMNKLQQYLGGREVIVITDHEPLEQFHRKRKSNSKRVEQWLIKNQDVITQIGEVKYRKGSQHGDADGMSRPDVNQNKPLLTVMTRSMTRAVNHPTTTVNLKDTSSNDSDNTVRSLVFNFSMERIREEQDCDTHLAGIKRSLIGNHHTHGGYVLEDNIVYKTFRRQNHFDSLRAVCIPISMRQEVLKCYHDHPTAGHFGVHRTWLKMKQVCFWQGMKQSIADYIRSCEKCARFNIRRSKPPGRLRPIEYPEGALELVSMDFWGPTAQPSANGNKYVLIITDYYTRYVVAIPVPNNTAITTAQCFVRDFVFKFGIPRRLITDQGVHFVNQLMKNITSILGTNHSQTSSYHPQSNGLVERFNGTFHAQIAKLYNSELNDWDDFLAPVIYAYNTGIQSTTGYSPFQLMFGRQPVLPLDYTATSFTFNRPNDYWNRFTKCLNIFRQTARSRIQLNQQYSKRRFDENRKDSCYEIDDLVLWKLPGHRGKLQERFSGPYIVVKKQHPSYTIQHIHSGLVKNVHISDLKILHSHATKHE